MPTRLRSLLHVPRLRPRRIAAAAMATALVAAVILQPGTANAADLGSLSLASATSVGVHDPYEKTQYNYLAQALDAGSTVIELDEWANVFTGHWNVSQSNPIASDNNCVYATNVSMLYTGTRDQNLDSCLDDIRIWLTAHPTNNPIIIKLEMKNGFYDLLGLNPTELDGYIAKHLGNLVYKPADLLTKPDRSQYATLDDAAKAGNWPTRSALQGKVIIEMIPGTFEKVVSPASTWVDVVYAAHLKALQAAGTLASAEIFPSVLGAQTGDPRTRYSDTTLRPWFVVFDGDAATFVTDGNTEWYNANHYLVVATDAYRVSPALSATAPSLADAQARVALLAADGVSFVSTDWVTAPANAVLTDVVPRG